MTKTLVGSPEDEPPKGDFDWPSAYDSVPYREHPIACSLQLRSNTNDGKLVDCPNAAVYDTVVTCPESHERVQHYCKRCFENATANRVACRICRAELDKPVPECLVTVLTSCDRDYSDAE